MNDYKHKYIDFVEKQKKLNNNSNHKVYLGGAPFPSNVGDTVKTEINMTNEEKMNNGSFWLCILHCLRNIGWNNITHKFLRSEAGLNDNPENHMSNSDFTVNKNTIFLNAAQIIATNYNLKIQIFWVNQHGKIIHPRAIIGDNNNKHYIEIAQFGLLDFQLINNNNGVPFKPCIDTDNLAKLELNDTLAMTEALNYQLNEYNNYYNNQLKSIKDINDSQFLNIDQKNILLTAYNDVITQDDRLLIIEKLKLLNTNIYNLINRRNE
jgi:hypothetical protein